MIKKKKQLCVYLRNRIVTSKLQTKCTVTMMKSSAVLYTIVSPRLIWGASANVSFRQQHIETSKTKAMPIYTSSNQINYFLARGPVDSVINYTVRERPKNRQPAFSFSSLYCRTSFSLFARVRPLFAVSRIKIVSSQQSSTCVSPYGYCEYM